ncbi:MAG: putative 2-amino-4-hydroxy-6-hydroxymethyldihydropteridine pyrophosphokinae [Crocinitomicaceae bacterium]|jgi:2-amino-4-hydroxy-6-hydroxymethyldihydropteridine diphosphokinase|nr:putative 2-amino-4-hydroxy-6-hydroxymethyldihydropteridine pyrophosphokinae [Crocinitomicaceae bacterium]
MHETGKINRLILGLGSNLGDRVSILQTALTDIAENIGKISRQSGLYTSPAHGFESENDFINLVIEVETPLSAFEAHAETLKIEEQAGRKNKSISGIYEDRFLDIDILFFNDEIIESEHLHIPHKNLADRKFVLVPLVEILPGLIDPKSGKSSTELLKTTTDGSRIFLL